MVFKWFPMVLPTNYQAFPGRWLPRRVGMDSLAPPQSILVVARSHRSEDDAPPAVALVPKATDLPSRADLHTAGWTTRGTISKKGSKQRSNQSHLSDPTKDATSSQAPKNWKDGWWSFLWSLGSLIFRFTLAYIWILVLTALQSDMVPLLWPGVIVQINTMRFHNPRATCARSVFPWCASNFDGFIWFPHWKIHIPTQWKSQPVIRESEIEKLDLPLTNIINHPILPLLFPTWLTNMINPHHCRIIAGF